MPIEITSATDAENVAGAAKAGENASDKGSQESASHDENSARADETAGDSEALENDETQTTDSEEEGDEEAGEDVETDDGKKPKKKGNGFRRRIDKLTKKVSQTAQELEYWKAQALKGREPEKVETQPPAKAAETPGKPKANDFETTEEYFEALAEWKADQKLSAYKTEQREQELKAQAQQQGKSFQSKVQEFKAQHEDFDDLMEEVDDIPMSIAVQEILLASENGPELMYELAKNREEYERICKLPPLAAAREMGKFEASLKRSSEELPPKKVAKAGPPPINPVGSGGSGGAKKSIFDPHLSQSEYERLRREQMRRSA